MVGQTISHYRIVWQTGRRQVGGVYSRHLVRLVLATTICAFVAPTTAQEPASGAGPLASIEKEEESRKQEPKTLIVNGVSMEFVAIVPGEFMMGCSPGDGECEGDENPAHQVRITKAFELGKYEVTQAQWQAVMGSNPSFSNGSDHPVEQVSWNDVQKYLAKLNARNDGYRYRLPTEAEWEYVARAGTTGKNYGDLDEIAWYGNNSARETHPVGQKRPNAWGLYDMSGNVWEWCGDRYGEDYYRQSPAADPTGPTSGSQRVRRGGSCNVNSRNIRVSNRGMYPPSYRRNSMGFRCAREGK